MKFYSHEDLRLPVMCATAALGLFLSGESWCQTPDQFAITLSSGTVGRYEKLEIVCPGITTSYANPFDPSEVSVEGHFRDPDGIEEVVYGFWYQGYTRSLQGGNEVLTAAGTPHWRVRYAPRKIGSYSCHVTVTDASGTVRSETETFTVQESDNPGFLRVSGTNPNYFQFDNGDPFWAIGAGVSWWDIHRKTYSYDDWFTALAEHKANFARIWMVNSIDEYTEWVVTIQDSVLGADYDLADAWRLDHILDVAEAKGIYIQLNLEDYCSQFTYNWWSNIYNAEKGGCAQTGWDVFPGDSPCREHNTRLWRYLAARYGHSTNLASWELANEINEMVWTWGWDGWWTMLWWHKRSANDIHEVDPYHHMVTTSFGQFDYDLGEDELWQFPEMSYTQVHGYRADSYLEIGKDMANYVRAGREHILALLGSVKKPEIWGEFGMRESGWDRISAHLDGNPDPPDDTEGIYYHNAIWASLMHGFAGTPLNFEWGTMYSTYPQHLDHYSAVADFLEDIDFGDANIVAASSEGSIPISNPGFETDTDADGVPDKWTPQGTTFQIDSATRRSGQNSIRTSAAASDGKFKQDYWHVGGDLFPNTQYQLSAWVKTEGVSGGASIFITIYDGANWHYHRATPLNGTNNWKLVTVDFATPSSINQFNLGGDVSAFSGSAWWDDFELRKTEELMTVSSGNLRALGLKNDNTANIWIQNKEYTWYAVVAEGKTPSTVSGASLTIPNVSEGDYSIAWWDTRSGVVTGTSTASTDGSGNLTVSLPHIQTDVACKIARSGGGGDTTPPTTPVISTPSQVVNADTFAVELSVPSTDENFSNYQLMGDQYTSWTNTSETNPFVFTLAQNAPNTLSVRGRDTSGNVGSADSVLITEDSVLPTTPVLATPNQVIDAESIIVTLATPSTDDHFSTYQLRGGQYASWTDVTGMDNFQFSLTQGAAHTLRVRGRDQAGNVGAAATMVVDEDSTLPTAPVIATEPRETNADSITVALASPSTDAHFACYQLRGGQYSDWTDTTETDGFAFTLTQNAENLLQVRGKDSAGHVSAADSVTITENSDAPSAPAQPAHAG